MLWIAVATVVDEIDDGVLVRTIRNLEPALADGDQRVGLFVLDLAVLFVEVDDFEIEPVTGNGYGEDAVVPPVGPGHSSETLAGER